MKKLPTPSTGQVFFYAEPNFAGGSFNRYAGKPIVNAHLVGSFIIGPFTRLAIQGKNSKSHYPFRNQWMNNSSKVMQISYISSSPISTPSQGITIQSTNQVQRTGAGAGLGTEPFDVFNNKNNYVNLSFSCILCILVIILIVYLYKMYAKKK
jgi:hypothetical protein